jgi:hypothetical protein
LIDNGSGHVQTQDRGLSYRDVRRAQDRRSRSLTLRDSQSTRGGWVVWTRRARPREQRHRPRRPSRQLKIHIDLSRRSVGRRRVPARLCSVDQGHVHGSRANARGKEIQLRAFALDRREAGGAVSADPDAGRSLDELSKEQAWGFRPVRTAQDPGNFLDFAAASGLRPSGPASPAGMGVHRGG